MDPKPNDITHTPKWRRPLTLTKAAHAEIVAALEKGCTLDMAADLAGIKRTTVRSWRRKGSGDPEAPAAMRAFYVETNRAIALTAMKAAAVMRDVISGETVDARLRFDAAKWWLSRGRYGEEFREAPNVDVPSAIDSLLDAVGEHMSQDAWREFIIALDLALGE